MSPGVPGEDAHIAQLMDTALRYHKRGELTRAESLYREVLRAQPEHADALQYLGMVYREQQPGLALELLRRAAALKPDSADAQYNLGVLLQQGGDAAHAAQAYRQAVRLRPAFFEAWFNLALVLAALDEPDQARSACESALQVRPGEPMALNNLGTILEGIGQFDEAIRCYETAAAARPGYVEALVNLAQLLERQHRHDDARRAADLALARDAGSPAARAIAARLDLRAGEFARGHARLQGVDLDELPHETAAAAWQTQGDLCERLGRYEEAWAAFTQGNRRMAATPRAADLHRAGAARRRLARLAEWFSAQRVAAWPSAPPEDGLPAPIFLVGFPRSGTTLLDQMLSSHPDLYTLEEHQVLRDVLEPFLRSDAGLARLDLIDEQEWRALRMRYWERLAAVCLGRTNKRYLIDKYPLNLTVAGVIQRLFPEARLVVAQRDPRDVCTSCFVQNFALNAAMVNFLTLPGTVSWYAQVMDLWLRYDAVLPLARATVRYEDLVADPRAVFEPVLELIGVAWNDALLDYAATARRRTLRTPSYARVTQPLDASAVGRWRNYRAALEPFLPQLAPFVRTLGYDEEA